MVTDLLVVKIFFFLWQLRVWIKRTEEPTVHTSQYFGNCFRYNSIVIFELVIKSSFPIKGAQFHNKELQISFCKKQSRKQLKYCSIPSIWIVPRQGFTQRRKFKDRASLPVCFYMEVFCSMFNFHLNAHGLTIHRQNSELFMRITIQVGCFLSRTLSTQDVLFSPGYFNDWSSFDIKQFYFAHKPLCKTHLLTVDPLWHGFSEGGFSVDML